MTTLVLTSEASCNILLFTYAAILPVFRMDRQSGLQRDFSK